MDFFQADWQETLQAIFALLGAFGLVGAGGVAVKRKWDRAQAVEREGIAGAVADEWKELALIREKKVEDLETQVLEQRDRISRLEGQLEAVMSLKEQRIADRVVELLNVTGKL